MPRPPVRALDPGPVLPDGRLLRPGRPEGRPGERAAGRSAARPSRRPSRSTRIVYDKPDGRGHARPHRARSPRRSSPSRRRTPRPPRTPPAAQELAAWITSTDNPYFARSYVNRLWGYLFGVGIIEPIDDIRAGNPPTNPELLDYLTAEFIKSGFDVRHVIRLICKSRTYQLSVATNKWNEDDKINYSHAIARRLPAEVLYDAVYRVTGLGRRSSRASPPGTRAAELPDSGVELPSGFLATFGRPARESACECERSSGLQLGPVMALVSGPTIGDAIGDPDNELAKLVKTAGRRREAGRRAVPPRS